MNNLYLAHHGILGQKWGERNGPPYPLGYDDHSVKEKAKNPKSLIDGKIKAKASVKKSKNSYTKQQIDEYRSKMAVKAKKSSSEYYKKYSQMTDAEINAELKRKEDIRKALIAGTVVVGIGAATYACYKAGVFEMVKGTGLSGAKLSTEVKSGMNEIKEDISDALNPKSAFNQVVPPKDSIYKTLVKGTEIHRMEAVSGKDISKVDELAYTAFRKDDVQIYRTMLRDWSGTGKRYDTVYKVQKDIAIPKKEVVEKIVKDLYDKDPSYKTQLLHDYEECIRYAAKRDGDYTGDALDEYVKNVVERAEKQFTLGGSNSPAVFDKATYVMVGKGESAVKLSKELTSRGYDAVMDYFDMGKFTNEPVIMLDPKGTLSKIGETVVKNAYF